MTHAGATFDTDYARLGTKNPSAKVHMHMRQLAHVLALLSVACPEHGDVQLGAHVLSVYVRQHVVDALPLFVSCQSA